MMANSLLRCLRRGEPGPKILLLSHIPFSIFVA